MPASIFRYGYGITIFCIKERGSWLCVFSITFRNPWNFLINVYDLYYRCELFCIILLLILLWCALIRKFEVDFILLAGYLKLIPVELIRAYPKSIVNIHPSLLPAFGGKGYYGMKVHKAVIASGARYSTCFQPFLDQLPYIFLGFACMKMNPYTIFSLDWLDFQVLQYILLMSTMTQVVFLLKVLFLCFLMTLQRSWLLGFFKR